MWQSTFWRLKIRLLSYGRNIPVNGKKIFLSLVSLLTIACYETANRKRSSMVNKLINRRVTGAKRAKETKRDEKDKVSQAKKWQHRQRYCCMHCAGHKASKKQRLHGDKDEVSSAQMQFAGTKASESCFSLASAECASAISGMHRQTRPTFDQRDRVQHALWLCLRPAATRLLLRALRFGSSCVFGSLRPS